MPHAADITAPGFPALPILHEDEGCLAVEVPPDWAPPGDPGSGLAEALESALASDPPWARERRLRFLRPVPHLDPECGGVLLLARSPSAADAYARLLDDRRTLKEFLAVTGGKPPRRAWTCCLKTRADPAQPGRVLTHTTRGAHAETEFEALAHAEGLVLLAARPRTHRPHQIRVHLAAAGLPVLGDLTYGFGREIAGRARRAHDLAEGRARRAARASGSPIALRAVRLAFVCPLTQQPVDIHAPYEDFLAAYGFEAGPDPDASEEEEGNPPGAGGD